jgi:hypothetical protein
MLMGYKYTFIYIEPIDDITITNKLFENVSEFGLFIVRFPINIKPCSDVFLQDIKRKEIRHVLPFHIYDTAVSVSTWVSHRL